MSHEASGVAGFRRRMDEIVEKFPDKTCFTLLREAEDYKITFSGLKTYMLERAAEFEKAGLKAGDRAVVMAPVSPFEIMVFLALAYYGVTSVLVDPSLPDGEKTELIRFADVRAIFAAGGRAAVPKELSSDGLPVYDLLNTGKLHAEGAAGCAGLPATPDPEEDVIAILFSSGTTDQRKGVKITYDALVRSTDHVVDFAGITDETTYLGVLPFCHLANFTATLTFCLNGGEVGFIEKTDPAMVSAGLLAFNPVFFVMIPKVYEVMEQKIRAEIRKKGRIVNGLFNAALAVSGFLRKYLGLNIGKPLFRGVRSRTFGKNIRILGAGAAPMRTDTARFYLNLGLEMLNCYALTETNLPACCTGVHYRYPDNHIGRIDAYPDVKIKISDPDENGVGEVRIRTEMIMKGYFRRPDLTEQAFDEEGYFRTGDYGRVDRKGYLRLTGRVKESIILENGKKVSPVNVDDYYGSRLPELTLASRGVVSGCSAHDEIYLFVENHGYSEEEKEKISGQILALSRKAPDIYRVSGICFTDAIPRTAVGKIRRFMLEPDPGEIKRRGGRNAVKNEAPGVRTKGFSAQKGTAAACGAGEENTAVPDKTAAARDTAAGAEFREFAESASPEDLPVEEMTETQKEELLQSVIEKYSDGQPVTRESRFKEDLGIDSLGMFELVSEVEDVFHTEISEFMVSIKTPHDLMDIIRMAGDAEESKQYRSIEKYPAKPNLFRKFLLWFMLKTYRLIFLRGAEGLENIQEQSFIICSNHPANTDPIKLLAAMGKENYAGKKIAVLAAGFMRKINPLLFDMLGCIPVQRSGNTIPSLKRGKECLEDGYILFVFPEGRLSGSQMHPFKGGAGILAAETDKPILPARIKHKFPIGYKVEFGKMIYPEGQTPFEITDELWNVVHDQLA